MTHLCHRGLDRGFRPRGVEEIDTMRAKSALDEFTAMQARLRDVLGDGRNDAILIGGVAVSLYALQANAPSLVESTHDADLLLSLTEYSALRDREEVTPNRRLQKSQVIHDGLEIDVYVERNYSLSVPYEDAYRHSKIINDFRVACPEHVIVLKADAGIDRRSSLKGEKDMRDIARLITLTPNLDVAILGPYLSGERQALLTEIGRRPSIFEDLADHNAHAASKLRASYERHFMPLASTQTRADCDAAGDARSQ